MKIFHGTLFFAIIATLFLLAVAAITTAQQQGGPLDDLHLFGYQPKANTDQIVMGGKNARFTVLTDYVIRMEYSSSATFDDRATLAVVNRVTSPAPSFTQSSSGSTLNIKTNQISLTYTIGQPFSASSLQVASNTNSFKQYSFGDKDTGNLLGTIRSLDDHCTIPLDCDQNTGIQTNGENLHCAWAVMSKLGWTTINDTQNFIMEQGAGTWFQNKQSARSQADHDVYFFGHGTNFKQALADWSHIGGKVPIPSRPLLGSWFTRWFDYDQADLKILLDKFVKNGIPLDVLILDMNWHQKDAWTGFTWDGELFPVPNATLDLIRGRGLMTAGNIHDAQGVHPFEKLWPEFAKLMGYPPQANTPVMFSPLNATYMRGVEDILLGTQGANFDFYWTDWQQGGDNGGCNGYQLNPTFITDHVRWSDNMRRGVNKRSNNFARFGGLGSHRYPVGFTGDVSGLTWQCMSYQPYFSVTASNVGFGYPSHDLVGPHNDHELHVRWMQFGAFSGVMRIHDRGMSSGVCWDADVCAIVDIWTLPYQYFDAIRDAMKARVGLLPYIYREARRAYDTGLNFVHGLYIDFPTFQEAYQLSGTPGSRAQYMFGDNIMVAVITQAADPNTELVDAENIWIPPGTWYDNVFGTLVKGPQTIPYRQYSLADIPMFIKAGSIIPRLPTPQVQGIASKQFSAIDWYIYPGASSSSYALYEDDGDSWDYISNGFAWSNASYQRTNTNGDISISLSAATGGSYQPPKTRAIRVFLVSMNTAASVKCGGTPATFNNNGGANTWTYDGFNAQVIVDCGSVPTYAAFTVTVSFISGNDANGTPLSGAKGFASRTALGKRLLDERQETAGIHTPHVGYVKQAGGRAGYLEGVASTATSQSWSSLVGTNYKTLIQNAITEIQNGGSPLPGPGPMDGLVTIFDEQRNDIALCGTEDCLNTNSYYRALWIEGFQPLSSYGNAVKLYDWWNAETNDNWATTSVSPPAQGYTAAIFDNGYVANDQVSGQTSPVCLQTWQKGNNHFTFASNKSLDFAQQNGFTQSGGCFGYVYTAPQQQQQQVRKSILHESFTSLQEEKKTFTAGELLERIRSSKSSDNINNKKSTPPVMASLMKKNKKHKHQEIKNRKEMKDNKLNADNAKQLAAALLQSALNVM